jgi:hypothetical protein
MEGLFAIGHWPFVIFDFGLPYLLNSIKYRRRVRTESGSDRIKRFRWLSQVSSDPVATARGSDTQCH